MVHQFVMVLPVERFMASLCCFYLARLSGCINYLSSRSELHSVFNGAQCSKKLQISAIYLNLGFGYLIIYLGSMSGQWSETHLLCTIFSFLKQHCVCARLWLRALRRILGSIRWCLCRVCRVWSKIKSLASYLLRTMLLGIMYFIIRNEMYSRPY